LKELIICLSSGAETVFLQTCPEPPDQCLPCERLRQHTPSHFTSLHLFESAISDITQSKGEMADTSVSIFDNLTTVDPERLAELISALVSLCITAFCLILFGHIFAGVPIRFLGENTGAGKYTRLWGYDNARGEFPHTAAFFIAMSGGIAVFYLLKPYIFAFFGLAAWLVWRNLFAPLTSKPPPPRRGKQLIKEVPQFPPQRHKFNDLHKWRFLSSKESHDHTEKCHADRSGLKLTGIPEGRQIWIADDHADKDHADDGKQDTMDFCPQDNPNSADLLFRALQQRKWVEEGNGFPDTTTRPKTVLDATRKAIAFYEILQCDDGHFAGDYGGPNFLMPGLITVWYVMGRSEAFLSVAHRQAMSHYLRTHQQTNGGWGTHIESPSTMMGTVLSYISLRMLGADRDDPAMIKGREFMKNHGGALYTASWAKFYLCLLGVMDWKGHNSVPIEMFLLPDWIPFHPGRLWCHCRMVYLPMAYLYGVRFVYDLADSDPLTISLREELYVEPYDEISWSSTRHLIAECDNYSPIPTTMKVLNNLLVIWEKYGGPLRKFVRNKGLAYGREYMHAEDLQTNFICIGPVNKVLNMLSAFHYNGNDFECEAVQRHLMRIPDYLWIAEDGMKMQGYNGSQCWDTAFAVQAVAEAGLCDEFPEMTSRIYSYMERTQILSTETARASPAYQFEDPKLRKRFYRHISEGGWPFSTSAHGWPISDCTAEGLKASLAIQDMPCVQTTRGNAPITRERMQKAIDVILALQNTDGGWATYENTRGFGWYESLNPSEVFGDIMIDYCYVECSCASMGALAAFNTHFPDYRGDEVHAAMNRGRQFMLSIQRKDGSWYGSWACCLTYGTWFGIEGLMMVGEKPESEPILNACSFLLSKQNANGGWGEDFSSCYNRSYAENGMEAYGVGGSGIVPTAWALMALMTAKCSDTDAVTRGIHFLLSQQRVDGDFPQQGISGVFNRACGITYTAYRNVFPIYALGKYARHYAPNFGLSAAVPSELKLHELVDNTSSSRIENEVSNITFKGTTKSQEKARSVVSRTGIKPLEENASASNTQTNARVKKKSRSTFMSRIPYAIYASFCVAGPVYALHLFSESYSSEESKNSTPPHHLHPNCSSYEGDNSGCPWPDPIPMLFGLLAVVVGQIFVLTYYSIRRLRLCGLHRPRRIQAWHPRDGGQDPEDLEPYAPFTNKELMQLVTEYANHLSRPGGFLILGSYLALTWMFDLMPPSYYDTVGVTTLAEAFKAVDWIHVLLQLMITDGIQFLMHLGEHRVHPDLYKRSHKPHHEFKSPILADAFDGSVPDTTVMILIPLVCAAHLVPANVWSYMAFGSIYGNYLCLIHSEFAHPFDRLMRLLCVGTASDHHVHHRKFVYNYGHIFMLWDRLYGSYLDPTTIDSFTGV
jgi:squalene/oxidosqualene cyclase-like protein